MHLLLPILLFSSDLATAWKPGLDKDIWSTESNKNLFKRSIASKSARWLPGTLPIRGVNLGCLFVFEPWSASDVWANDIGCGSSTTQSEFDCVSYLGQDQANTVFQSHWGSWIVQDDFTTMASYGLNTVRIPVGFWMLESLVYSSEHFPQGGIDYLLQVCDWAREQGFYVIIDLHGAPYSQAAQANADTGQLRDPGFYQSEDAYSRTYQFLTWMTQQIHSNSQMANVGMIEILNEPEQVQTADTESMINTFYSNAYNAIREAESALGVTSANELHIQVMSEDWGSGNPNANLTDLYNMAYDNHRYLKYAGLADEQSVYLSTSCSDIDNLNANTPTIVGEWSLSTNMNEWDPSSNIQFYNEWWAAQVRTYEQLDGWIFWTWKTSNLNDPRWDYQLAVAADFINVNPEDAYSISGC